MSDIEELTKKIIEFRDARDWQQFHNPKDLAVALSVESSELLETFLWKESDEADDQAIKEELADILTYAILLAHEQELNIKSIVEEKLSINEEKYPVDKSRGKSTKYSDL